MFGFNGQEKDNEVSGLGNSNTAEFWQYDTRLGRRWNIDPVVKGNRSGYVCFSNNPIILIDPDGRTDYYNKRGKWIGTDGIDNGAKQMAIKRSTARIIKKATRKDQVISMNPTVYTDIVQIPNQETVQMMNTMWDGTVKKGIEYTMVVGQANGKEDRIVMPGKEEEAPTGKVFNRFVAAGGSPEYSVHTHPLKAEEKGDITTVSGHEPSYRDVLTAGALESSASTFHQGANQSVVIGPSYSYIPDSETGKSELRYSVMISFYTGQNTTQKNPGAPLKPTSPMVPNVEMSLEKFTKAANRANKDHKKRRGGG